MERSAAIALFVVIVAIVLGGSIFGIYYIITGTSAADFGNESFVDIPSKEDVMLLDAVSDLQEQQDELRAEIEAEYRKAQEIAESGLPGSDDTGSESSGSGSGSGSTGSGDTGTYDEDMATYESCPYLIRQADDELDDAEDRERDKERDVRKEEDSLDSLKAELADAQANNATTAEIERIEDRIDDQEDDLDDAEDELDDAEDETQLARERLESVQDMCDELRQKLSIKNIGTSHLTSETCDIEIQRIRDLIDDIDDDVTDAERDVDRAEDALREAEDYLSTVRVNGTQAVIDRAEERVEDARDDVDDAEDDLDREQDRLHDAREELRIIRQKCKDLR